MNRENKSIVLNRNHENKNRTIIKLEAQLRNFIGKNISISISTTYNNFEVIKRICFFLYKMSSLYHWIDRRYRSISKNLAMYIFVQRRDKNYFAPDILIRFQHSNFKKRVHEFAQLSKTFEKKKGKMNNSYPNLDYFIHERKSTAGTWIRRETGPNGGSNEVSFVHNRIRSMSWLCPGFELVG